MSALLRSILDWVQTIVGNYGWAVIVFSLLIKGVLLPLDVKSRKSMRAMSALNPKLEDLKRRYANDQEKLNQKTTELYRKNKVNPLSGCLPMLIQLPVLFIMFSVMRNAAASIQLNMMYDWVSTNLTNADTMELISAESAAFQDIIARLTSGEGIAMFGDTHSWLWIKSVFQPDTFSKTFIPTMAELKNMISSYSDELSADKLELLKLYVANTNELASAVDAAVRTNCGYTTYNLFFNFFPINIPSNWNTYVNGYFILPVLAGLTQFISNKLQPVQPSATTADGKKGGSGAFMKWFFPIFSVYICISSTAAFAIYWVFVNIWTMTTNFAINKFLEIKEARANVDKEAIQP